MTRRSKPEKAQPASDMQHVDGKTNKLVLILHPGWNPSVRPASATRDRMDRTAESFAYRWLIAAVGSQVEGVCGDPSGLVGPFDVCPDRVDPAIIGRFYADVQRVLGKAAATNAGGQTRCRSHV